MSNSDVKIFIVEDEHIVALDIKEQLKDLGYNVCGVSSDGEDAVNKILFAKPNLVLMDIMLKGKVNGIEAASKIIKEFSVPIIFLTGNADETTLNNASIIQPFHYLIKPFEVHELHKIISTTLSSGLLMTTSKEF